MNEKNILAAGKAFSGNSAPWLFALAVVAMLGGAVYQAGNTIGDSIKSNALAINGLRDALVGMESRMSRLEMLIMMQCKTDKEAYLHMDEEENMCTRES